MAAVDDFGRSISGQMQLLENLLQSNIDGLIDDVADLLGNPGNAGRIDSIINAGFDDIIDDFEDGFDAITNRSVRDLRSRGFKVNQPSQGVLDALDDLRTGHIEEIQSFRGSFSTQARNHFDKARIPGLSSDDSTIQQLRLSSDAFLNQTNRNGATYSRVFREAALGGIKENDNGDLESDKDQNKWEYKYVGPADDRNRPHCSVHVGKVLTKAEITKISPNQIHLAGDDPAAPLYKPFYTEASPCRHNWVLVRTS